MKLFFALLFSSILFLRVSFPVFADSLTPTPTVTTQDTSPPAGTTLGHFFNGFDWISDGFLFHTPDVFADPIVLQDGAQLAHIGQFTSIFWDIAIPLFAIILSIIAISHLHSDNPYQLKNFGKRLVFVTILFIISERVLEYSIEAVNLLNQQIMNQGTNTLIPMIVSYVNSSDFQSVITFTMSPVVFFSPGALLQILLFVIAFGFFLIGFLYIVLQAIARFIGLLILSVLLPVAIPLALSERTQNMTNTFFKVWFTLLIGQPAFILGYCLCSAILVNLLKDHGGSVGTLFLFSASLLFLGGINMFVGKIFGDGWSLVATDVYAGLAYAKIQSFVKGSLGEVQKGMFRGQATGLRSSMGAAIGRKMGFLTMAQPEEENKKISPPFKMEKTTNKKMPRQKIDI